MIRDLEYTTNGMFTHFVPNTKAGESAYNEMAKQMEGVAAVFDWQLKDTLKQLRSAGYSVGKARKATKQDMDSIYNELKEMGI